MEYLDLIPGTDDWLVYRLEHFCASEVPAMMDQSKFMSRNQLLAAKKGWKANPVGYFKQQLFDKGHEHEAKGRVIQELEDMDDYPPVVGRLVLDDLELLASFDGLSGQMNIWEHKDWNETLAENVRNGILEPQYYWQLEQQMLVAGQQQAMLTVSDGTREKRVSMIYHSVPDRRDELILGWSQFSKDLDEFVLEALEESVEVQAKTLPALVYDVQGTDIVSNIKDYLSAIKHMAEQESNLVLESDQDFADKERFNRTTKEARAKLKQVVADVQGEFVSFAVFSDTAKQIDEVLQKMQAQGERQVKEQKQITKDAIVARARVNIVAYLHEADIRCQPMVISTMVGNFAGADFAAVIKNKRTIESLQNSVDSELARVKIDVDQIAEKVMANLAIYNATVDGHESLFYDLPGIINQPPVSFTAVIKTRISEHKEAEAQRMEAQREAMRLEEERKAMKKAQEDFDRQIAAEEKARQEDADAKQAKQDREDEDALKNSEKEVRHERIGNRVDLKKEAAVSLKKEADRKTDSKAMSDGVKKAAKTKAGQATFESELEEWVKTYNITAPSIVALTAILNKYWNPQERKSA